MDLVTVTQPTEKVVNIHIQDSWIEGYRLNVPARLTKYEATSLYYQLADALDTLGVSL